MNVVSLRRPRDLTLYDKPEWATSSKCSFRSSARVILP
ncbi:hypothetical protein [Enterobacter hormaechei]